jgi:carboxyl-terminal processing protease
MRRSLKIPLLIVGGLVAAVLLVTGGFLLGARDDLGSAIRGLFPVVSGANSDGSSALQQEVLDKLDSTYYKSVDDSKLHAAAIDGMVASLDDPYTVYWDPDEYAAFKESTSGSYTGLGMGVEMDNGLITVISTFKQSPADVAGITTGDIIVSVEGRPVDGRTLQQVVDELKGGAEGTTVSVGIYRPPAPAATTTTTAGAASSESTTSTESTTTTTDPLAKADTSHLPPGGVKKDYTLPRKNISIPVTEKKILQAGDKKVALIGFFTFSQGSATALRAAVKQAIEVDEVNAVILDLRGNGGGLLDQAVDVASIFLPQGDLVVSTQGLHSPKQVYKAVGGDYPEIRLYVLTDPFTASASEIVSGALQDYGRAVLVGETTFGKGLVQSIEPLSNGGALKATTAVYLTPKGRDINKTGIAPEVSAPDDPATTGVDETVEATLKLITGEASVPSTTTSTTTASTTSTTAATE